MTRKDEMRAAFARFEESGLTLKAFGEREQIPYTTLQYWRRRFRGGPARKQVLQAPCAVALTPVRVVPDAAAGGSRSERFEVWLTNGISLEVAVGFDEGELRRLVSALTAC